jgi:hypothetical protein
MLTYIAPATYGSLCAWRVAACVFRLSLVCHILASLHLCTHSLVFASDRSSRRATASLDFFVNGTLVAQDVPFEDRHCSNLSTCFICNASEEACVLWSSFIVSSVLAASIGSVTNSSDACGVVNECVGAPSTRSVAVAAAAGCNNPQCDCDIILNGDCESVVLQATVRVRKEADCRAQDVADTPLVGFSSVFSLQAFNTAAIDACNRAVHGRDISRLLLAGDAFADVVFIAEGVRFPAHKVGESTPSSLCMSPAFPIHLRARWCCPNIIVHRTPGHCCIALHSLQVYVQQSNAGGCAGSHFVSGRRGGV